jgi:hypothetical protein
MTKILPTVGRVVWFTPSRLTGDYGFTHIDSRKPLAAIVTHIFHDALVNLTVFDSNGVRRAGAVRCGAARRRPRASRDDFGSEALRDGTGRRRETKFL